MHLKIRATDTDTAAATALCCFPHSLQRCSFAACASYCGGFFFLKRPPRAFMVSAGVCVAPFAAVEPRPPAQPSCDLSKPAARPPTSGINFGSAVVPRIRKGTVVPLLQPPPLPPPEALPRRPPKSETGLPTAPSVLVSAATILKSRLFLESTVPAPERFPTVGTTAMKFSA